ncbi:recombinase family protein [Sphingomonas sp. LY54]|uniref:recombinase family protein n=1 Tax=Sphingomonas sp. LY54 TaxID=3095343 RepID=UPI002D766823|nr:recombinase family protein [Sphingomonas sp. LY54]WRP29795.1 recombinase family protein [Sphingomonas sp. LY54]
MTKKRCAIYTRKSSEEGLNQDFNSLDAQREACEAYITSQKSEGWSPVGAHYDDGGWSGGNIDRPALKALLADIDAGRVDVVVVYKVDRLTRSLADFARIVDLFDRHGVSFVSVTQAFNTTSSMGRLTLNVLLSFAQFEREVTGERIRDKIAASKAKGMWMGGYPPLGYDQEGRTLKINEVEAEAVRHIFRRYVKLGSVYALCNELEADGIRTKMSTSQAGITRGGVRFSRGSLYNLLGNPIYVGEIRHKDKTYPGQHPPIVERELFGAAQEQRRRRGIVKRERAASRAPLSGILHDALGHRMSATHARGRSGQRYPYYISRIPASHPGAARVLRRVPGASVEDVLISSLRRWSGRQTSSWIDLLPFLKRVELHRDCIVVELAPPMHENWTGAMDAAEEWAITSAGRLQIIHPVRIVTRGACTSRVEAASPKGRARPDKSLIAGLRRSHAELNSRGIDMTDLRSQQEHARGMGDPYLRKLSKLALLAPDIQRSILEGLQPSGLTLGRLLDVDLPLRWDEQRQLLGFPAGA